MQKIGIAILVLVLLAAGGVYAYQNNLISLPFAPSPREEQVFCTADAKMCPDGSYVGRTGPNCEFVCPPTSGIPTTGEPQTVTLALGERKEVFGIFIKPISILEDSRCPIDVQCIQAGTVRVKMQVETGMGLGDMTLTLNEVGTTEAETIVLTEVTPAPVSTDEISSGEYRLTFELKKRTPFE